MTSPTLLIASRNAGKVREFAELLSHLRLDLRDLSVFPGAPSVTETGDTYLANARCKALTLARFTGLPTLADDSGIEVDALDGAPGVRSARFAYDQGGQPAEGGVDRDNTALLLERLQTVPDDQRTARFRCVIVVSRPDGRELIGDGTCEGLITRTPSGHAGFGYDPVFYYPPAGATFAEMGTAEKQRVSHRARACRAIEAFILPFLATHY